MRSYTKNMVGATAGLMLFFSAVPAHAAGLTSDQINAVISLLNSFGVEASVVANVQAVLNGHVPSKETGSNDQWSATATSTASGQFTPSGQMGKMACITLNRNLGIGSRGDDVKSLQELLSEDPEDGFTAGATGFFGPLTAKALMHFQMNNGIASTTDGSVGPLTRGFFERRCGKGLGHDSSTATTTRAEGRNSH